MNERSLSLRWAGRIAMLAFAFILSSQYLVLAQTASLRGRVTDQGGAVIQGARVVLSGPGGFRKVATTDGGGAYSFTGQQSGEYVVEATAPSLALAEPIKIKLNSSGPETLNLQLQVVIPEQKVTVDDSAAPRVSTEAGNDASAKVLQGDDLRDVSLSGSYVLNRALSNTDGLGTFPAKPYDSTGEYGPAATDIRHRFTLTGSINTKWNIRFSPFVVVESGAPFDITVGRDLYGTTSFNGRPGIAADPSKPGLIQTKYGLLDPNPTFEEKTLSRNFGRGPGAITVNLRLAKTIEFGGEKSGSGAPSSGTGGGGLDRRGTPGVFTPGTSQSAPASSVSHHYNLSISMAVRNLLNHTNPGPIIGNITSPLFGEANQPAGSGGVGFSESANNRRLELQLRFTF